MFEDSSCKDPSGVLDVTVAWSPEPERAVVKWGRILLREDWGDVLWGKNGVTLGPHGTQGAGTRGRDRDRVCPGLPERVSGN